MRQDVASTLGATASAPTSRSVANYALSTKNYELMHRERQRAESHRDDSLDSFVDPMTILESAGGTTVDSAG